jgi:ribosomal protein S18 acetylase RimI-like enzyme
MTDVSSLESPAGLIRLRPERDDDQAFRFELFCNSRLPEWSLVTLDPAVRDQLMRHQFVAQTSSYLQQFPAARFDIIELDGCAIGRIVVDRPGAIIHIVDQAIVPGLRNRGIGTAIMRALIDEAAEAGLPVQLEVADNNDPSMRLYLRLGFVPIEEVPFYIRLEWTPASEQPNVIGSEASETRQPAG